MVNGNGKIAKPVGIITLGAVTNVLVEYATTKVSKDAVAVDKISLNTADAVGTVAAIAEVLAGSMLKKPGLVLFGAGGLGLAVANIVGKAVMAYNPLAATSARIAAPIRAAAPEGIKVIGSPGALQAKESLFGTNTQDWQTQQYKMV